VNKTIEYKERKFEMQHVNGAIWLASEGVRALAASSNSEEEARGLALSIIDAEEIKVNKSGFLETFAGGVGQVAIMKTTTPSGKLVGYQLKNKIGCEVSHLSFETKRAAMAFARRLQS
jgi:hypothetical protein